MSLLLHAVWLLTAQAERQLPQRQLGALESADTSVASADTIALVESAARRFPSEPKAEDLLGLQLSTSSKSLLKNHLARDSGA